MENASRFRSDLVGQRVIVDPSKKEEFNALYRPHGFGADQSFVVSGVWGSVAAASGRLCIMVEEPNTGRHFTSAADRFLVMDNGDTPAP